MSDDFIDIQTPQCRARIARQGAHLLHWQPHGHAEVLWVSQAAIFAPGKAVRGGVPVCWPWFGPGEPGLPAHGFARTRLWEHRQTWQTGDGTCVRLGLRDDASTRAWWNHAFDLEMQFTLGTTLSMALTTHNTGLEAFEISQALHSYFQVGDIGRTSLRGLEGAHYLDKLDCNQTRTQQGAIRFDGETDRVYVATDANCTIDDVAQQRRIIVSKSGSHSTVVWNPWVHKSASFTDMAHGEYRHMLCVETANAAPDEVTIQPGERHTLCAHVRLEV